MKHQCHADVGGVPISVAANRGQDNFQPIDGVHCLSCMPGSLPREFSQRVATWHYRIHLADLVHATACGKGTEEKQLLQQMVRSPYIGHAQITINVPALQGPTLLPGKARTTKCFFCDMCSCQAVV